MSALREILAAFSISVDTKPVEQGNLAVDGLVDKIKNFGKISAALFAGGAFAGMIKSTIAEADALDLASNIAGIAADEYQRLVHAADMADVSAETLATSIGFLQKNLVAARDGSKEATEAFDKLGIATEKGVETDTLTLLTQVADRVKAIQDPAEQTAIAMSVFGRGGRAMLPMLKEGGAALAAYADQVQAMGGGFGNEFLELADKFDKHEKELSLLWRSLRVQIVGQLVPVMLQWGHALQQIGVEVLKLNKHGSVMRAAWVGGAVMIAAKLGAIAPTLGRLALMVTSFARTVLLPIAGFLALTLVLEDLLVWFRGGESVIGHFFDKLDTGISKSAALFGETFGFMVSSWDNFVTTITAIPSFVGMAFTALDNEITQGVSYAIAFLQDQWTRFLQSLQLPSWAQTMLGGDAAAKGDENTQQASQTWDKSRENIGSSFTREIETNDSWQNFLKARDTARLNALPQTTPGVPEGTPWRSMIEGQPGMPSLAPALAAPASIAAMPAPATIQNTSVLTNNIEHKPVVNVTLPSGNPATVKASVTKALTDSNAGLVNVLEHTKD